jgi:hypothetical protein
MTWTLSSKRGHLTLGLQLPPEYPDKKNDKIKFQKSASFKNPHAPRDKERKRERAITRV